MGSVCSMPLLLSIDATDGRTDRWTDPAAAGLAGPLRGTQACTKMTGYIRNTVITSHND